MQMCFNRLILLHEVCPHTCGTPVSGSSPTALSGLLSAWEGSFKASADISLPAFLFLGYYSKTYVLIEPSSPQHTPTLPLTPTNVHIQPNISTCAGRLGGSREVWDHHCDE